MNELHEKIKATAQKLLDECDKRIKNNEDLQIFYKGAKLGISELQAALTEEDSNEEQGSEDNQSGSIES